MHSRRSVTERKHPGRGQTGRLYNYAFAMIIGLIVLLAVLVRMTAGT